MRERCTRVCVLVTLHAQETYLFGLLALVAGIWLVVTAMGLFRRKKFEFFYWSHFVFIIWYVCLVYPLCVVCCVCD
jgi:heme O synthase-like polyprenyltransferase